MGRKETIMSTKVITGKCRASFVHIFEPKSVNGSDPKYSMSLIIPKSDSKTIGAIKAAIDEAIQNGISGKWGGKRPPNLKLPLRDGDVDREEDEAYQDAYFVNATSLGLHEGDPMPLPPELMQPGQCVYDIVTHDTALRRAATARGCTATTGQGMLLWQGAIAFERWFGISPDTAAMRNGLGF